MFESKHIGTTSYVHNDIVTIGLFGFLNLIRLFIWNNIGIKIIVGPVKINITQRFDVTVIVIFGLFVR